MSDVFHEVEEELRRDKANELWKRHGNKLITVALAIVVGVGGWRLYESYMFKERAADGAAFEAALTDLNAGKPDAAGALTALAAKKGGAYPALARLRLAGDLAAKAKDEAARADAVSAYDAIAADAALPAEWRDFARLRAAYVLVDHAAYEEVEKRLMPLADKDGAYRHSAREGIALAAYRTAKFDKALDALQAIILDADAPAGLRQRAERLLAVVRSGPVGKTN